MDGRDDARVTFSRRIQSRNYVHVACVGLNLDII
jgi:hypothetical protein